MRSNPKNFSKNFLVFFFFFFFFLNFFFSFSVLESFRCCFHGWDLEHLDTPAAEYHPDKEARCGNTLKNGKSEDNCGRVTPGVCSLWAFFSQLFFAACVQSAPHPASWQTQRQRRRIRDLIGWRSEVWCTCASCRPHALSTAETKSYFAAFRGRSASAPALERSRSRLSDPTAV